jgi:hypothetical protein
LVTCSMWRLEWKLGARSSGVSRPVCDVDFNGSTERANPQASQAHQSCTDDEILGDDHKRDRTKCPCTNREWGFSHIPELGSLCRSPPALSSLPCLCSLSHFVTVLDSPPCQSQVVHRPRPATPRRATVRARLAACETPLRVQAPTRRQALPRPKCPPPPPLRRCVVLELGVARRELPKDPDDVPAANRPSGAQFPCVARLTGTRAQSPP